MRMCCCLAPTLAGAEIFDSWMCLTVEVVACRLYILDKRNHTRPLVVGLSNVNKPRLSILFFKKKFYWLHFVQKEGGGSGDVSSILIYSSDGVCGNVCVGLSFFPLPEFHLYPQLAQKLHRSGKNQNFNRKEQSRGNKT